MREIKIFWPQPLAKILEEIDIQKQTKLVTKSMFSLGRAEKGELKQVGLWITWKFKKVCDQKEKKRVCTLV